MKIIHTIIGLILLALLVAGIAYSQSQPTPPKGMAKSVNYKTDNQQQYADKSSFVNKKPTPQTSDQTTKDNKNNQDNKTITDFWIMCATIAIAVFAFFQILAMIFQYCAMQKQARQLKRSVDVLSSAERAFLYVIVYEDDIKESDYLCHIKYRIINCGKTPATVTEISHHGKCSKIKPIDPCDHPIDLNTLHRRRMIISANSPLNGISYEFPIDIDDRKEINDGGFIWFYGRVVYYDIFEIRRECPFYWRYERGIKRFRPYYEKDDT